MSSDRTSQTVQDYADALDDFGNEVVCDATDDGFVEEYMKCSDFEKVEGLILRPLPVIETRPFRLTLVFLVITITLYYPPL